MATEQLPKPFCPDCGTHSCPYPDQAMHRPKRPLWKRLLGRR